MKTIIKDDRSEEQKQTHRWLVVGTDTFLSGWGHAAGGLSVCAWAYRTADEASAAAEWVKQCANLARVRIVHDDRYKPRVAKHFHVYVGKEVA